MATKTKTASRATTAYTCRECGWTTAKWVGRCGECQAWDTLAEADQPGRTRATPSVTPALPIGQVSTDASVVRPTGVAEFDRVLGGGLVVGSVVLVAGEPGIGKSTLLLDVAARAARAGRPVLYASGEESASQIRLRAERIGAMADGLYLTAETDLGRVLGQIEAIKPDLVVIDSVQTIASAEIDGQAGGVTQVREVAAALIAAAKAQGICVLLVGHVTKDGSIAGPRLLEHLVDVVVSFEGDRHSRLRLVRSVKNRYGPTEEVGCFDLGEGGIVGLADPSGLFVGARNPDVPGTCVTVTLEGRRPLLAEIQALVTVTVATHPRRATSGLDSSRVAMVSAVLDKRGGARLGVADVYAATVGGMRVTEPAADLALALALASCVLDAPMDPLAVAFGEVGLAGEIRPVTGLARRLGEAARLGFTTAYVPCGGRGRSLSAIHAGTSQGGSPEMVAPSGIRVIEVRDIHDAVARALERRPRLRRIN